MITEHNYKQFKKSYLDAVKNKETVFYFDGQQVLTDYAKYVCEYVDSEARVTETCEGDREPVKWSSTMPFELCGLCQRVMCHECGYCIGHNKHSDPSDKLCKDEDGYFICMHCNVRRILNQHNDESEQVL
jgi:hypothetical protein